MSEEHPEPSGGADVRHDFCCNWMNLYLREDDGRAGLVAATFINYTTNVVRMRPSIRIPAKVVARKRPCVLPLNFCPFCGTSLGGDS